MASGILCQACGIEAPTKYVEFHQNIGALVMRFHKQRKGNLCKNCVHKHFWSMTGTTLAIGWLGMISIVLAPIFVINNIVRYLGALGMPAVPAGATVPQIDNAVMARVAPIAPACFARVNKGEDLGEVVRSVAPQLQLTPGQVLQSMIIISRQSRAPQPVQPPTGGFPVVPLDPTKKVMPSPSAPVLLQPIAQPVQSSPPEPNKLGL